MKSELSMSGHVLMTCVLLCATVLALVLIGPGYREKAVLGQNDFLQSYAAGRVIGHGDVYSVEEIARTCLESAGVVQGIVSYMRLPFWALILKPLTWLPYIAAYILYSAVSLLCFAGFVRCFLAPRYPSL